MTLGTIVREALMTYKKVQPAYRKYGTYEKMKNFEALPVAVKVKREKLVMYEPITDPIVNIPSLWPDEELNCIGRTVSYLEIGNDAFQAYQEAHRKGRTVQNRLVYVS